MDKTTPLTAWHNANQALMAPFAGYLMPIQYAQGILHEHRQVRERAGVFDVSHMGEFVLSGPDALANLNHLITNDFTNLTIGAIRYGILVKEDGTAVDDVLVYRLSEQTYWVVVNASNIDKDEAYFRTHLMGVVDFANISDSIGQIALQGPLAQDVLASLTDTIPDTYYHFIENADVSGIKVLVSRTGYTGEDGFELYCDAQDTLRLWELLLRDPRVEACGLGARDTLRLEAAMPLYGHELSETITPLESGLKMFVKLDKLQFIAQTALSMPPKRKRIGLVMIDRGIAREGSDVYLGARKIGVVTSGTHSPTLNKAIAMALIEVDAGDVTEVEVDVRGRRIKAARCPLPFYKRNKGESK